MNEYKPLFQRSDLDLNDRTLYQYQNDLNLLEAQLHNMTFNEEEMQSYRQIVRDAIIDLIKGANLLISPQFNFNTYNVMKCPLHVGLQCKEGEQYECGRCNFYSYKGVSICEKNHPVSRYQNLRDLYRTIEDILFAN